MMRVDLDAFVEKYFENLYEFSENDTADKKNKGQRIKALSDLSNLTPKAKQKLLKKLSPLYLHLWNNYFDSLPYKSKESDQVETEKLKTIADKLKKIEACLFSDCHFDMENLLALPLTFMDLAKHFVDIPKEMWRPHFLIYYHTGLYDIIIKHNPIFKLHFTANEKMLYEISVDKDTINGLYVYAQKLDNFSWDDLTEDEQNILDKAIIFLRSENYRLKRLSGPEYTSFSGRFLGHSRTTKCDTIEKMQNLILQNTKLEEFVTLLESDKDIGLNELSSQFVGGAGDALMPLFIHMAIAGKFPSHILVDLGIKRSNSLLNYFSLSSKNS